MKKMVLYLALMLGPGLLVATAQEIPKWKISDLETFIANCNKPTVVNFWATFCKPCIEEIPHFQKLVKQYEADSVHLLLVSLDMAEMYPEGIKNFAQKFQFTAPVIFLDETNADVFCPRIDSTWSGAIPATLFINNKTGYRKFVEGKIPEQSFEAALKAMSAGDATIGSYLLPAIIIAVILLIIFFLWYNRRNGKL